MASRRQRKSKHHQKRRSLQPPVDRGAMDPRLTLEKVNEVRDGEGNIVPGDYLVAVAPVELADGRVLYFRNPQAVVFNLHEAARHRRGGEKLRLRVTTHLTAREGGDW